MGEKPSLQIPGASPLIKTFEEKRRRIADEFRARATRPLAGVESAIKSAKDVPRVSLPSISSMFSGDDDMGLPPPKLSDRVSESAYRYVPPKIQAPRRRLRRDMGFDDVGRSPGFAP